MRLTLLVLGAALLCVAVAQQTRSGRERIRDLVQRARAGDLEAQDELRSRRKNARNRADTGPRRGGVREQAAVESILGGGARSSARRPSFQPAARQETPTPRARVPLRRNRQRGGARESEVRATTFHPSIFTTTPEPTTASPIEFTPTPIEEAPITEVIIQKPAPVEQQVVDLTPTNEIPSIFQPAQFNGRGVGRPSGRQPALQQVQQTREPTRRPEGRRISILNEPHRALNNGLEISSRSELFTPVHNNEESTTRTPPVQTIRRYSYFDDAGNYVFGYEAEDGSFKEEVRGLDCIVNGKYGYVDPTGTRREFTYVSGNKCDPNNPDELLPLNDQFLHQTQQQQLSESEVAKLALNRRRKPTQRVEPQSTPTRLTRPSSRPAPALRPVEPRPTPQRAPEPRPTPQRAPERRPTPQRALQLRPTPQKAPEPARQPERRPVDLTPTNTIPDMFKPAQFGQDGRGVVAQEQQRFPVPAFIQNANSRQPDAPRIPAQPPRAPQQPRRSRPQAPPTPRPRPAPAPTAQPVQPSFITHAPTAAPSHAFNFDQEFQNLFTNFDRPTAPRPAAPRQQAPRPTAPKPAAPKTNEIPSLFRPAQFNSPRPAPPKPAAPPRRPPIDDNSFTLSANQPNTANQLVFDASTGTFKTVHVQNPINAAPRAQSPPPNPFAPNSGKPLPLFASSQTKTNTNARNPLPPIPTSAADFNNFFANFAG